MADRSCWSVGALITRNSAAAVVGTLMFSLLMQLIGVLPNFRKLWQEGIGKLVAVYALSLFGFIIWVGLLISWIFFAGVKPPLVTA